MIYQTQLEGRIYEMTAPSLEHLGYKIVRIRMFGMGKGKTLQVMIEKLNWEMVNIEDCEKASKHISAILDVEDPIDGEYSLEMSSGGLDRPLTRIEDFEHFNGSHAKITTRMPINGQKRFTGTILGVSENKVAFRAVNVEEDLSIDFANMIEAHIEYFARKETNKKPKKKGK